MKLQRFMSIKVKKNRYKDAIKKCQRIKNVDSFYKKMCDKL